MKKIAILIGTVYGGAQYAGEQVSESLQGKGFDVYLSEAPSVEDFTNEEHDVLLVITSTTGQGEVPPNLEGTFFQLKNDGAMISGKQFGVIALGDTSYGDTYCQAGRMFDELLEELQGKRVGERLQIDACETMEPEVAAVEWAEDWATKL